MLLKNIYKNAPKQGDYFVRRIQLGSVYHILGIKMNINKVKLTLMLPNKSILLFESENKNLLARQQLIQLYKQTIKHHQYQP